MNIEDSAKPCSYGCCAVRAGGRGGTELWGFGSLGGGVGACHENGE